MKFGRRKSTYRQIESTALTDIVFLLLIFFLLTSSFVSHTGIKVDLPGAKKPIINTVKKNISISINEKGQIYLNDDVIEKSTLQAKLETILETDEEKIVILRPDKSIRVEQLIELMDIANLSGASRLIIATKVQEVN